VVFTPPDDKESKYGFRVAGLPGEKLELADDGLRIDGALIKHPTGIKFHASDLGKHAGAVLGEDEYFVLGDNPDNARDSRHFGPIRRGAISGEITKIESGRQGILTPTPHTTGHTDP
jgi:signal peptidase I